MYLDLLATLENSWLGHVGRHSAWLYMATNLLHVLGAAFVVGGIAVFDLKVLTEHGKHAWQVGRYAIPLAATGLALQIPTGLFLLAVEARALGVNPDAINPLAKGWGPLFQYLDTLTTTVSRVAASATSRAEKAARDCTTSERAARPMRRRRSSISARTGGS